MRLHFSVDVFLGELIGCLRNLHGKILNAAAFPAHEMVVGAGVSVKVVGTVAAVQLTIRMNSFVAWDI